MQEIELKYFASLREALGKSTEAWVGEVETVADLRDALAQRGEPYTSALGPSKRLRVAVNQVLVEAEAALPRDRCEVAFFPPVTGG